ncbi:hypothetical protein ACMFMG_011501 [Clarireedia jacksonii]
MVTQSIPKIQLNRVAHVYYQHTNVEKQRQFLQDFGFREVKRVGNKTYYSGYGRDPWVYCLEDGDENKFRGAGFVVESLEDLENAASTLPNASEIYDLTDAPGGGKCVTFYDPVDDFPMHLVYGQVEVDQGPEPSFPEIHFNFPEKKTRPANQFQRFEKRPAPIHKLGHFGMVVTDFPKTLEFYTSRFNLITSNLLHTPDGKNVSAFNRLDRGSEFVDHHTFFFFEGPKCHVHHSSFETHDFDTQVLGHDWLRQKGYESCWGVGRHIMGSQIFDYWFDTSRFILEHYVDGDLMDNKVPTSMELASVENLAVWGNTSKSLRSGSEELSDKFTGPDVPPTFLT